MANDIIFSATVISDLHALGQTAEIPQYLAAAREAIQKAGKVIIEQRIENTQSRVIASFTELSDIDKWEEKIKEFLNSLSQKV